MIHVERAVLGSLLAEGLIRSGIPFRVTDDIASVPDKKSEIILKSKKDLYCHPCPATKIYRCCNYYTTDVMEGCPYDCSYCILQAYLDHKNIQVSADTESILNAIKTLVKEGIKRRLGTGELSDSLALDHIFPFTKLITPVINAQDTIQFEFKTKSSNIGNLLNLNPKNIVVAWSLNPEEIVLTEEPGAATAANRIAAARACAEAGYKVAFHFDPMIYYDGFEAGYEKLLELLLNTIPRHSVEYISISSFRATSALVGKMREREDISRLLKGDMVFGLDGKVRYFKTIRILLLGHLRKLFYRHWPNVFVYYCMEHASIWDTLEGFDPGQREDFESLFPWSAG